MIAPTTTVDVVVMEVSERDDVRRACVDVATALRSHGYNVDHLHDSTVKRATKYLDRSGCYAGVLISEREVDAGVVRVIETRSAGWLQYDVSTAEFRGHYLFR